jgi:Outer membrane protein and related peptidoglycan-associated (lipo)proteins
MVLKPKAGDATSLVSWRIDLIDERDAVQRTISGKGASLPESVEWDGKSDAGIYAPEGIYTAALYLDYGIAFSRTIARSKPFVLDLTPPTGAIDFSTDRFSPEGDGMDDIETITLSGSSKYARLAGWTLTVLDPGNNVFVSWKGGWPIASVDWDGRGLNGDLVESASDYPLALSIRDEFGNIGVVKRTLTTGILAIKTDEGYRIRISSIVFKAFTADYEDVPPDRAARNLATLDLLAKRLAMFPDYKVKLEGHAVMINWNDKAKGDEEQRDVLIPLSQARAKAIEAALVERDIPVDRLVASGVGADNPVVPDSDYANRWKNRRVEFYLLK